jgi:DNA-binding NtrC family response regulator
VMRNLRTPTSMPAAFVPTTVEAAPVMAAVESAAVSVPVDTHNGVPLDQPLREARDQFERVYFEFHLARENYSMTRVAERAGLERTHLYRKLKQLGIELARGARRDRLPEAVQPAVVSLAPDVAVSPPVYVQRDDYDD